MANSDYIQRGGGTFAPLIETADALDYLDTVITFDEYNFQRLEQITASMAAMCDDEIMLVVDVAVNAITVKRGCADTVPAQHAAGSLVWFITGYTGGDGVERAAGETIGVKLSPFTTGGGTMPIVDVQPLALTFDHRFFRPYAPAHVMLNAARWFVPAIVETENPTMELSWRHRDRVLIANKLVGHDDAAVGPEPGTTYTVRVYDDSDVLKRTEVGIVGQSFLYHHAQALADFGYPVDPTDATITLHARRDDIESMAGYTCPFSITADPDLLSYYTAINHAVIEAPYVALARQSVTPTNHVVMAMAARPADRMNDEYDMHTRDAAGSFAVRATPAFTPWIDIDFKLVELETTATIRTSSLYDGVDIADVAVGQLALIGDEIVRVDGMTASTVTLARGCADTIPQSHIAGSRIWFFETVPSVDPTAWDATDEIHCRLAPIRYDGVSTFDDAPDDEIALSSRSLRPLPPGQIVVDGRPWFEEASSLDGEDVDVSWARRNRITQGSTVRSHTYPDIAPEVDQQTRVRITYDLPSETPGDPATLVVLREYLVDGQFLTYPYAAALVDGNAAGTVLGVCGSVVVDMMIDSVRDGMASWQRYTVPLRLPSYSCPLPE